MDRFQKLAMASLLVAAFAMAAASAMAAKNVIIMVPDGCNQNIQTLARWYKKYGLNDSEPLNLDKMVRGQVATYMANSVITGSAAATTAFATGYKTSARFIGVGPRPDDLLTDLDGNVIDDFEIAPAYAPLATVLEAAKMKGKATGLISTSRITHATPAAYGAHIHDRGMDNEIMEHLVYNDIDVVFGGGKRHLLPAPEGKRTDGENLLEVLLDRGYQFVETADEMAALTSGKAWGLFDSSHMAAEMDRKFFKLEQPSLSEMTAKAIELLSRNRYGFIIMIEGSQVDWAGHANDPAYMVNDFIEFDKAVGVALDYAKNDPNTAVLVFPDHDTGGITIGNDYFGNYTATSIADIVEPLTKMQVTAGGLAALLPEKFTIAKLKEILLTYWGLEITNEDAAILVGAGDVIDDDVYDHLDGDSLTLVLQKYIPIGWTTHGHTGGDVPLWAYGGPSHHLPLGYVDNTELAKATADMMHCNLAQANHALFMDLDAHFPGWTLDENDPENPVIVVGSARLPAGKDIVELPGDTCELDSLVVYAPMTGKAYIPKQAASIIQKGSCEIGKGKKTATLAE